MIGEFFCEFNTRVAERPLSALAFFTVKTEHVTWMLAQMSVMKLVNKSNSME
jgi:hypothetical protein